MRSLFFLSILVVALAQDPPVFPPQYTLEFD